MNDEDRKFLTEAMGEDWHEVTRAALFHIQASCSCGESFENGWLLDKHIKESNRTFTTWADFGAVLDFAREQEWHDAFWIWIKLFNPLGMKSLLLDVIDRVRFHQLVVDFLREKESKP